MFRKNRRSRIRSERLLRSCLRGEDINTKVQYSQEGIEKKGFEAARDRRAIFSIKVSPQMIAQRGASIWPEENRIFKIFLPKLSTDSEFEELCAEKTSDI